MENGFLGPNRLGEFTPILLVDVGDNNGSTVIRKPFDYRTSDPRSAPRNDCDLILKPRKHTPLSSHNAKESIKGR